MAKVGVVQYDHPLLFSSTEIELLHEAELWRCQCCASGFIQNSIQPEDVIRLYTNSQSAVRWTNVPFVDSKTPEVVQALQSVLFDGGTVVDVGCNTGEFLDFAKASGCRTVGVELSSNSRSILLQKGHSAVPSLGDIRDESADLITGFDLIEHLHDVNAFLSLCRVKLKTGGQLILLTGDMECVSSRLSGAKWWYSGYPEHIAFPSRYFLTRWSRFELLGAIPTYASIGYRAHPLLSIASWLLRAPVNRYRGLPSIGHDHYLYTLRK